MINTSAATRGQIYLPTINWLLMLATVAVVVGFRSSASLAAAFGLAVSATMAITTVLFAALARWRWNWPLWRVAAVSGGFLAIDLAFLGANVLKFADGGWLPLLLGTFVFLLMLAWWFGRRQLARARADIDLTLDEFIAALQLAPPHCVEGMAVFLSGRSTEVPTVLMHHLKHNQVLHEQVVLLTLETVDAPRVPAEERLRLQRHGLGFLRVIARFGFMETPNVPAVMAQVARADADYQCEPMRTSFYLGHESLVLLPSRGVFQRALLVIFIWLRRNELDATAHLDLPANRVVEMGARLAFRPGR